MRRALVLFFSLALSTWWACRSRRLSLSGSSHPRYRHNHKGQCLLFAALQVASCTFAHSHIHVSTVVTVQRTTICLVNKGVSRLLLQNQTFLTKVRAAYTDSLSGGQLTMKGYMKFLKEFRVVPQLCTLEQAQHVFELVNMCDEYVHLGGVVVAVW